MIELPEKHGEIKCSPIIQAVSASALATVEESIHGDPATGLAEGVVWRQATGLAPFNPIGKLNKIKAALA